MNLIKKIAVFLVFYLTSQVTLAQSEFLVDTHWLEKNINNPTVRLIEVSVVPGEYERGHIQGAVNFKWHTDLVDTVNRDIVSKDKLQSLLQKSGINQGDAIVIYGDKNNWFAAWAAWVFDIYGIENVKLLDGGKNKWKAEKRALTPLGTRTSSGNIQLTQTNNLLRARLKDVVAVANKESDFALLELTETIPSLYNVNYAGWSAEDVAPQQPVGIHHPSGDIKKISFDYDVGISDGWSGNDGSHWRVSSWEDGTTEPGSSGSPLFDNNYRIVGQLHGGQASCSFNFNDYYGKVSASWDWGNSSSNRLKDWLDPEDTGTLVLDSYDTGGGSPELTYSPDQLEFSMGPDETDNQIIIIINSGGEGSVLSYEIDENSGWISVNPDQGEIEEGSSQNIYVTVNTNGMNEGTYQSVISITSNGGNIDIPIVLTISGTVNINQNYDYGWNLVGLPVETQSNFYANLFPYAVTTTLYSFISGYGYQSEENLVNGTGYWLRMSQSNTTAFTGEEINAIVIPLLEGWNLISGISSPVPLDNIVDLFELIVPNTIYGYNSGYFLPEDIIPGKAYWLRSSGNGNVGLYTSNLVSSKEKVTQKLILMK